MADLARDKMVAGSVDHGGDVPHTHEALWTPSLRLLLTCLDLIHRLVPLRQSAELLRVSALRSVKQQTDTQVGSPVKKEIVRLVLKLSQPLLKEATCFL